jgi:dihydroflavonol-4-reductase
MSLKVAVTGASGHIGNVVCHLLIQNGYQVKAFYQSDSKSLLGLNLELVQGNILNKKDVARLVEGCDIVIHCAAIISISGDENGLVFKTNTEGPSNVLAACLDKGVKKLIHISSVHAVHDLPHDEPYNETRPYKQKSDYVYDYSKAMGEQLILTESQNKKIEIVILRPSCVIGPFDFKPSKMGKVLKDFYLQKIALVPPGGYDLVDVRDLATSILAAITKGRDREIYLLSGKYYSFKEIIQVIESISKKKLFHFNVPFGLLKSALPFALLFSKISKRAASITKESISAIEEGHPAMNHSKATKELQHNPRALVLTLSDYFDWLKDNNKL